MKLRRLLFILPMLLVMQSYAADLTLPRLFADHMVFQRNQPTKIWGWASPKQKIKLQFDDQKVKTKADDTGYFEAYLDGKTAGGPYTLTVAADTTITYTDILIGDVWIAGGQSNMEWQMQWGVDNWEEEVKDSDYPEIRFFQVPNEFATSPQKDISAGEWLLAGPKNTPSFSAVAWFFAKQNHREKNVPVGVIESHWGGTPAEAWASVETLTETPGYEAAAEKIINPEISWEEFTEKNQAKEARKWELMRDKDGAIASGAQQVEYDDSSWTTYELPSNAKMTDLAWLRKEVQLSPDSVEDLKLYINNVVQEAFVFFNGELIWTKTWSDGIEPLEIPKELVQEGKNVITYRVANSWDNNVYFGRAGEMWLEVNGQQQSLEGAWKYSNDVESKIPESIKMYQLPSFLYNAKIAPIGGYTARGVIWYQGESNADKPQYYRDLFANVIKDWRKLWGDDLAFQYVQLANFMARKDEPSDSDWARLREAQTETLSLPKTGMAVTIDIGDADDIHPRNKLDVGQRLWLSAKKVSYGDDVVYAGPMYKSHQVEGNAVTVTFDNIGTGLKSNEDKVLGFAIAGEDQKFYWADAKIVGDQVVLSASEVAVPVAVRYAWADNPATSLYNEEELPAVPFRTDDWERQY
ncbi:sialate O-acetylesterase [Reichenbachiella agariperforans]|uniref:sialate O-acetylesterase n=1 Tax=Reichenbachiella agariperforans TaxID=156994 RepID=UPI001C0980AE|nr:sialate O-acetylesterase [Reichenbachiella agariperforans]MBU2914163.1 sialate O-acetylesterase [Reichenbachiella agariperforans]